MSKDATALYDRLISDGCAYVIEIADKLPHFQVNAFAEVLHRDQQILRLMAELLDRVPSHAEGRSQEANFVTQCRRHIATRMDRLELFGLDFESQWYPGQRRLREPADQPGSDRRRLGDRGPPGLEPAHAARRSRRVRKDHGGCEGRGLGQLQRAGSYGAWSRTIAKAIFPARRASAQAITPPGLPRSRRARA